MRSGGQPPCNVEPAVVGLRWPVQPRPPDFSLLDFGAIIEFDLCDAGHVKQVSTDGAKFFCKGDLLRGGGEGLGPVFYGANDP